MDKSFVFFFENKVFPQIFDCEILIHTVPFTSGSASGRLSMFMFLQLLTFLIIVVILGKTAKKVLKESGVCITN